MIEYFIVGIVLLIAVSYLTKTGVDTFTAKKNPCETCCSYQNCPYADKNKCPAKTITCQKKPESCGLTKVKLSNEKPLQ